MNKINPLYLLGAFSFVAILMIVMSSKIQTNIIEASQQSAVLEVDGKYILGLKDKWKNTKLAKKRIDRILSHSSIKSHVDASSMSKGVYKIELSNMDVRSLDSFVNKMLNETVELKSLQIDRMSDKNASVVMECRI